MVALKRCFFLPRVSRWFILCPSTLSSYRKPQLSSLTRQSEALEVRHSHKDTWALGALIWFFMALESWRSYNMILTNHSTVSLFISTNAMGVLHSRPASSSLT